MIQYKPEIFFSDTLDSNDTLILNRVLDNFSFLSFSILGSVSRGFLQKITEVHPVSFIKV